MMAFNRERRRRERTRDLVPRVDDIMFVFPHEAKLSMGEEKTARVDKKGTLSSSPLTENLDFIIAYIS